MSKLWRFLTLGGNSGSKWILIGVLWLVSLALGHWGYNGYFATVGKPTTFGHNLHCALQLFKLTATSIQDATAVNLPLGIARFLAPAVMFYTVFQTIVLLFAQESQMLRLVRARGHVVLCGLGYKGLLLARGFHERGHLVAIIESDESNELIAPCRSQGMVVIVGDARDRETLAKARVHRARYLIALTGNDGANAEIAVHAEELVGDRKGGALECYAHIFNRELCQILLETEAHAHSSGAFRLEFFNVYDRAARVLLTAHPPSSGADAEEPHLVIVGLGRMGQSLVIRAARDWNDQPHPDGARLRITVVDPEAEAKLAALKFRYPGLDRICVLVPQQMQDSTPQFQRADFLFDEFGHCSATIIYVCLNQDAAGLAAALIAHRRLRDLGRKVPIVVRIYEGRGLADLLRRSRTAGGDFDNIHAFCLPEETCRPEHILRGVTEDMARALHRASLGLPRPASASEGTWDQLPEDEREARRAQAAAVPELLRALGYVVAPLTRWEAARDQLPPSDIERLARLEHERWLADRLNAGWRHGPQLDPASKLHPDLLPWDQLGEAAKDNARAIIRSWPAILAKVGSQIERRRA